MRESTGPEGIVRSAAFQGDGSAAATASAATTACGWSAEARLFGGAVSREHGELALGPRGAAVGARGVAVVEAQELLEMALALHADELVDRHRDGSLGTGPDATQPSAPSLAKKTNPV